MKNLLMTHSNGLLRAKLSRSAKWLVLDRDRSKLHLQRKIYHFLMGIFCFFLYAFILDRGNALIALTLIGGGFIALDLLRLRFPIIKQYSLVIFGKLMRREELKSLSGNSFYIFGLFLIVLFFPKPIVLLSLLFLAIGDPVAAIIGTLYGHHRILKKKSLEGTLANFLVVSLVVWPVGYFYFNLPTNLCLRVSLLGGVVSAIAELLPFPIDDNFTIPVLSAILLAVTFHFFPML